MKSSEQVEGETTHNTRLQHLIAGIRTAKVYYFCTVPANIYDGGWIASSTWIPRISNKPFIIYLISGQLTTEIWLVEGWSLQRLKRQTYK